jgi:NAD-dependent DNA ligase
MVALPEHIVDKLVAAGFNTVEDVRAADPKKIRLIEGIGRVAFEEIKTWLQSLDDEESGDGAGRL